MVIIYVRDRDEWDSLRRFWRRLMIAIRDRLTNVGKQPYRPIRVDGNVWAVVVEDGAGTVDDFLVSFGFRYDLLLHFERRQGDLEAIEKPST